MSKSEVQNRDWWIQIWETKVPQRKTSWRSLGVRRYRKAQQKVFFFFFVFEIVEERSAARLIPIIKRYVKPGSITLSDCWKAYNCLKDEGYTHLTVNHSVEFKNKETGACTNLIESTWNAVKKSLPKYGRQKQLYDSYLVEYCIRKKYLNNAEDKFLTFLELKKRVYPGKKVRQPLTAMSNSAECSEVSDNAANSSLVDLFDG